MSRSEAEILLWEQLKELVQIGNGYAVAREAQFAYSLGRKWRSDFEVLTENSKWMIEIDGGAWSQGRHTRGAGFIADLEKLNYAALLGFRVLRFTPEQVLKGEAIAFIKKVLES